MVDVVDADGVLLLSDWLDMGVDDNSVDCEVGEVGSPFVGPFAETNGSVGVRIRRGRLLGGVVGVVGCFPDNGVPFNC